MSLSDPDITQPNIILPRCCVPGCTETEPAVGQETCIIWGGKRLCYAKHSPDFASSRLSDVCSERGSGPTDDEWKSFLSGLAGSPHAKRSVVSTEVATHPNSSKGHEI